MGLFEITIAIAILVAAPVVFWFFYSIIAVRMGWEPGDRDPGAQVNGRVRRASTGRPD